MNQTITIATTDSTLPNECVTFPIRSNHVMREGACLDTVIEIQQVVIGVPIGILLLLKTNGDLFHWQTIFGGPQYGNVYAHIAPSFDQKRTPTEAQKHTVANWFFNEKPLGLPNAAGASLYEWAFCGESHTDVAEKYGHQKKRFCA